VLAVSLGWFPPSSQPTGSQPAFPIASEQITATLAKFHTPSGFHRGPCAQVAGNIDTVCFRRQQSVVLNGGVMARVAGDLGVTWTRPLPSCNPTGIYAIPHLRLPQLRVVECSGDATLGRLSLRVVITSVVWVTAKAQRCCLSREAPLSVSTCRDRATTWPRLRVQSSRFAKATITKAVASSTMSASAHHRAWYGPGGRESTRC
jgi:hypothetical protein